MEYVLVHPFFKPPSKLVAFYDGHTVAHNGIVRIPYDGERSTRWAKNVFLNGYTNTLDGRVLSQWKDVEDELQGQRSAESADADQSSPYLGRFTETEHGLRQGESDSSEIVPTPRVAGRGSRRANDEATV